MVGLDISRFPSLTVGILDGDGQHPPRIQKPAAIRPIIAATNHSASNNVNIISAKRGRDFFFLLQAPVTKTVER
jgi:hypothetical protein